MKTAARRPSWGWAARNGLAFVVLGPLLGGLPFVVWTVLSVRGFDIRMLVFFMVAFFAAGLAPLWAGVVYSAASATLMHWTKVDRLRAAWVAALGALSGCLGYTAWWWVISGPSSPNVNVLPGVMNALSAGAGLVAALFCQWRWPLGGAGQKCDASVPVASGDPGG